MPDSTSNPEGSQGYVTYTIKAKEGLDENTQIENTASIYFDFNPPIVTNTTQNAIVTCLPYEETTVAATITDGETYTLPDGMQVSEAGTYVTDILDEEGCIIQIINTTLEVLTNTHNLALNQLVEISPNPNSGVFNLHLKVNTSSSYQVLLYNITGQKVYQQEMQSNSTMIKTNGLPTGVYTLQLRGDLGEVLALKKIVVQH